LYCKRAALCTVRQISWLDVFNRGFAWLEFSSRRQKNTSGMHYKGGGQYGVLEIFDKTMWGDLKFAM
jgi:hypothetical protein